MLDGLIDRALDAGRSAVNSATSATSNFANNAISDFNTARDNVQGAVNNVLNNLADTVDGNHGHRAELSYTEKHELNEGGNWYNPSDYTEVSSEIELQVEGETLIHNATGEAAAPAEAEEEKGFFDENTDVTAEIWSDELELWDRAAYRTGDLIDGDVHTLEADVLGTSAELSGSLEADLREGVVSLEGDVSANAYLLDAGYELDYGMLDAEVTAFVGAEAEAGIGTEINLREGEIAADIGGEVFVGGKLEGDLAVGHEDFATAGVNGGLTYGIGAELGGEMSFDGGVISAEFDIGATLGVGVDLGVDVELNIPGIATGAWEHRDVVVEPAKNFGNAVRDFIGF